MSSNEARTMVQGSRGEGDALWAEDNALWAEGDALWAEDHGPRCKWVAVYGEFAVLIGDFLEKIKKRRPAPGPGRKSCKGARTQ